MRGCASPGSNRATTSLPLVGNAGDGTRYAPARRVTTPRRRRIRPSMRERLGLDISGLTELPPGVNKVLARFARMGSLCELLPERHEMRTVGRNAPCPCGSGRQHKQCCGANGSSPLEGLSPGMRMRGGVRFEPSTSGFLVIIHTWENVAGHG